MFKIGTIVIDSLMNENISFSNEVTSKAVEDGSEVGDNISHKPLKLSATCVLAGVDADQRYQALKKLANEDQLITYYGSLEPLLENMAVENVGVKRDASFGDGFEFDINLTQIKVTTNKTYTVISNKTVESKVTNAGKVQLKAKDISTESVKNRYLAVKMAKLELEV